MEHPEVKDVSRLSFVGGLSITSKDYLETPIIWSTAFTASFLEVMLQF